MTTKENIFSFKGKDLPSRTFKISEWGGISITIRAMNGLERDAWDNYITARRKKALEQNKVIVDNEELKAKLLILCAKDENGDAIFEDADIADIQALNGDVIDRLSNIAYALSGLDGESKGSAEKNLEKTPISDSDSDSPKDSEKQSDN